MADENLKSIRHEYKNLVDKQTYDNAKEIANIIDSELGKIKYYKKLISNLKSEEEPKKVETKESKTKTTKVYKRRSKEEIESLVDKDVKEDPRFIELNKLPVRVKTGSNNPDLQSLAKSYNIPKRTTLTKNELIKAIIEHERSSQKPTEEVVEETKEIIKTIYVDKDRETKLLKDIRLDEENFQQFLYQPSLFKLEDMY
jgi:hypothetical protein